MAGGYAMPYTWGYSASFPPLDRWVVLDSRSLSATVHLCTGGTKTPGSAGKVASCIVCASRPSTDWLRPTLLNFQPGEQRAGGTVQYPPLVKAECTRIIRELRPKIWITDWMDSSEALLGKVNFEPETSRVTGSSSRKVFWGWIQLGCV
jgi:hypothetical protein